MQGAAVYRRGKGRKEEWAGGGMKGVRLVCLVQGGWVQGALAGNAWCRRWKIWRGVWVQGVSARGGF